MKAKSLLTLDNGATIGAEIPIRKIWDGQKRLRSMRKTFTLLTISNRGANACVQCATDDVVLLLSNNSVLRKMFACNWVSSPIALAIFLTPFQLDYIVLKFRI